MKDLLLDVNIVVDVCSARQPWCFHSAEAIARCLDDGGRLWLYSGSVQTLEYSLAKEIFRQNQQEEVTFASALAASRDVLAGFCRDKNWLASLAGEGPVFESYDPENEQLILALKRFPQDTIKLLTRDRAIADKFPELTISPEKYLNQNADPKPAAFVDLAAQQDVIRPTLEKNIHQILHHGKYIMGPEVDKLEQRLAEFIDSRNCISCSSGTDALLMALMVLDVGPGDAVFTSPFTFIATAEVISFLGATPVFVDIDSSTFNMAPNHLEKAIQAVKTNDSSLYPLPHGSAQKTITNNNSLLTNNFLTNNALTPKAIMPVDLFGLPADYERINQIANKHGLWVIEDAAQSLGAEYKGKMAGNLAHIGCTSFFPAKPLGGYGDGGAIFTDDDQIAKGLKSIRIHGKDNHKYDNARVGINGRLDTLQAAVLLAKLDVFPEEIEKRRQVAKRYTESLNNQPSSLCLPFVPADMKNAWAQYSILARDSEERQTIQEDLKAKNIPSVIYYPKPLHQQSAFEDLGYTAEDMPTSQDCSSRIFSLPMHPYLTGKKQDHIVKCLLTES